MLREELNGFFIVDEALRSLNTCWGVVGTISYFYSNFNKSIKNIVPELQDELI